MKKLIQFLIIALIGFNYQKNYAQLEPTVLATDTLNINQARAYLGQAGFFITYNSLLGGYEVPKKPLPNQPDATFALFSTTLWLAAKTSSGDTLLAAQTYRQRGTDFWPGPVGSSTAQMNYWNRHFKVTKAEIDGFIANPTAVPNSILNWPAKNNPFNPNVGDQNLAPFFDANCNGSYNPTDGDYPAIKGDQAIWWIFNDAYSAHTETQALTLNAEVQCMAYAFEDPTLEYQTYYDVWISNKSTQTWIDFQPSIFSDPDLGFYGDDYIGCDSINNFAFCYNGDDFDGDSATPLPNSYILDLPLIQMKYGSTIGLKSTMYFNNSFSTTGNPNGYNDYYQYMNARWKDDTHLTEGGYGYLGSLITNYIYSGNPSDIDEWSECSEFEPPSDRRLLQNLSKFSTINPGNIAFFNFAIIFKPNAGNCFDKSILQPGNIIADSVLSLQYQTCPSGIEDATTPLFTLSPNPAPDHSSATINSLQIIRLCKIYDYKGSLLFQLYPNSSTFEVPLNLNAGLYFISLTTNDQTLKSQKIIVQ